VRSCGARTRVDQALALLLDLALLGDRVLEVRDRLARVDRDAQLELRGALDGAGGQYEGRVGRGRRWAANGCRGIAPSRDTHIVISDGVVDVDAIVYGGMYGGEWARVEERVMEDGEERTSGMLQKHERVAACMVSTEPK